MALIEQVAESYFMLGRPAARTESKNLEAKRPRGIEIQEIKTDGNDDLHEHMTLPEAHTDWIAEELFLVRISWLQRSHPHPDQCVENRS